MRKEWKSPTLEMLDIKMTFNGPGKENDDCFAEDHQHPGNGGKGQDPDLSNSSCLGS